MPTSQQVLPQRRAQQPAPQRQQPPEPDFVFPLTRHVLWDGTPRGERRTLAPDSGLPKLVVQPEPLARLAQRLGSARFPEAQCGWLVARSIGGGSELRVERFDPGMPSAESEAPAVRLDGDVLVRAFAAMGRSVALPLIAPKESPFAREHAARCTAASAQCPADFQTVRAAAELDPRTGTLLLTTVALVPSTVFSLVPITPPSVLRTPFTESLWHSQPAASSRRQQLTAGFLSLDQSRRVVVLQDSDPRLKSTPLVGVWVKQGGAGRGTEDAIVWASCCRFLFSSAIVDRALATDPANGKQAFLVALFSPSAFEKLAATFFQCTFEEGPSPTVAFECTVTSNVGAAQVFPVSAKFAPQFGATSSLGFAAPRPLAAPQDPVAADRKALGPAPPALAPVASQELAAAQLLQPIVQPLLMQIQHLQAQLDRVTQELARQQSVIESSCRALAATDEKQQAASARSRSASIGINTSPKATSQSERRDVGVGTTPERPRVMVSAGTSPKTGKPSPEKVAAASPSPKKYPMVFTDQPEAKSPIRGRRSPPSRESKKRPQSTVATPPESPAVPVPTPNAWRAAAQGVGGTFVTQQQQQQQQQPEDLRDASRSRRRRQPAPTRRRDVADDVAYDERPTGTFTEGDSHIVLPSFLDTDQSSFHRPRRR